MPHMQYAVECVREHTVQGFLKIKDIKFRYYLVVLCNSRMSGYFLQLRGCGRCKGLFDKGNNN